MFKRNLFFLISISVSFNSLSQMTINLYRSEIPNSKPSVDAEKKEQVDGITLISHITRPTVTVFFPEKEKANGTAVIICPGGGYAVNAFSHEGTDVALKFRELGIVAVVLKYRLPDDETMITKETGPLQDAQQAIKIVREHAQEWSVHPDRVGIMGFSAGGHLASTAGTHFENSFIDNPQRTNLRPDFMVLIYPVISFQESIGHLGSRERLLGITPSIEKIEWYSNEKHISKNTPPAFLLHASDDETVKADNSILFYQNLKKNNVSAELHIYQNGGHGFGMNNPTTSDRWMDRLTNWMDANGWLKK
ncbi:MAG: alpha/beta hydrolase [Bacteroidetes bacterium]|nr:alpha/beta hydrolase [Bacteroidota bacterium]